MYKRILLPLLILSLTAQPAGAFRTAYASEISGSGLTENAPDMTDSDSEPESEEGPYAGSDEDPGAGSGETTDSISDENFDTSDSASECATGETSPELPDAGPDSTAETVPEDASEGISGETSETDSGDLPADIPDPSPDGSDSSSISADSALSSSGATDAALGVKADSAVEPDTSALKTMIDSEISYDDVSSTWGSDLMELSEACEKASRNTFGGRTVTIAVIDTGINSSHELFSGRLTGGKSFVEGESYDSDSNGHGSHIAGIIAANTPSNVKIMPVKALNSENKGTAQSVRSAIEYAASNGADIINLSLGLSKNNFIQADGSFSSDDYELYESTLSGAVSYARSRGCIVITSAGNEGSNIDDCGSIPAGCDGCITVSALSHSGSLYSKSNYGGAVDFCAPGEAIYSAYYGGSAGYEKLSGTSMAVPFISSAYALLMLYNPESADDTAYLTDLLAGICQDPDGSGNGSLYGHGLPVFADGAVPCDRPERPVVKTVVCREDSITLKWDDSDGISFRILRKAEGENTFAGVGSSSDGTFTDSTVEFNRTYTYCIEAQEEGHYSVSDRSDEVTGKAFVAVTGINCRIYNPYDLMLRVNDHKYLYAAAIPRTASFPKLIWSSEDPSVATVSSGGCVTAVSDGTTRITIRSEDESYTGSESYEISVVSAQKCGDSVYWHYDSDEKTLVFLGEGDMYDFDTAPWDSLAGEIEKIVFDEEITGIGRNAFSRISVSSIEGTENIRKIANSAFHNFSCKGTFTLPKEAEISPGAFNRTTLGTLVIPSGVTLSDSFLINNNFGGFEIKGEHDVYSVTGDVLFSKDGTRLIRYPYDRKDAYSIPESVTALSEGAFRNCGLSSVRIPGSISRIPDSAFDTCASLQKAELPDSVTSIGSRAFYGCRKMESPHISPKLAFIGPNAFHGTLFKEFEIPEQTSLREIGDRALIMTRISSLHVPEGVTSLGEEAMASGYFEEIFLPSSLQKIGKDCFTNAFWACDLYYNGFSSEFDAIEGSEGVRDHINSLYYDARLLIDVRGKTGDLSWEAYGETGDVTLTISGNGAVPDYKTESECPWSEGRSEITKVIVKEGVTRLGKNSLCQMPNLTSIELPYTVTQKAENYGYGLFLGDSRLEEFVCILEDGTPLTVSINYLYAQEKGITYEPSVIVRTADMAVLSPESDYTVSYENTSSAGQGSIQIHINAGEQQGTKICIPFLVVTEKLSGTDIKSLSALKLYPDSFTYDGKQHFPNVVVKSGEYTLRDGSDYRLSYSGPCIEPGSYRVTATGIGIYTGTRTSYFVIRSRTQSDKEQDKPAGQKDAAAVSQKEDPDNTLTSKNDESGDTGTASDSGIVSKGPGDQGNDTAGASERDNDTDSSAAQGPGKDQADAGSSALTDSSQDGKHAAEPAGTQKEPSPEEKAPVSAEKNDSSFPIRGIGIVLLILYFLIVIFFVLLHRE